MHKPKETSKNQARMGNTDGMIMDVVSPVFNKNPKRQKNSSEKRGFSELFCLQSEHTKMVCYQLNEIEISPAIKLKVYGPYKAIF